MTPRQIEFIRHRAAGLPPTAAARAAGYSDKSAKVSACRMEAHPEIAAAIAEARQDGQAHTAAPEFETAEAYLEAVVAGTTPPDPIRVSAARALIQYQKARQRGPVRSPPPRQLAENPARTEERDMLDAWAEKAAAVRARLARK